MLFYANGSKEKNGTVPIMGRVTINGTVAQFSCKRSISKELWDAKGNRAKGKSLEARETNLALDNIKAQIIKHYQRISDREAFVTAEMVRNAYQGIGGEYETLLKAFDRENEVFKKRVGKDRKMATYQSRVVARNYVAAFIKPFYKRSDMSMLELTPDFIKEFAVYLSTEAGLRNGTIWEKCMWLKGVVMRAHFNGLIPRNPFAQFHISPNVKEREFLTEDELKAVMTHEFADPKLAYIRDLFVFASFTAQYYRDLKRQTGELEANVQQLQTEQRQAERQLDEVRKEIKSEKLEAAKTEAKTALVAKVGSLLGSGKLKEEREGLQQRLSVLEKQNEKLMQHIKQMEREHQSERTKFNEYIDKIQRYFPYVEKLLPLIDFCRNTLNFSERVIQELCKLKKVRLKGDFYSPEFNRKFRDENAAFSFEEDKNRKGHYHICVNDVPLVRWFRQKAQEWRNGFGIAPTGQDKGLKI